mgnify:FL=1|tara:strand:- start:1111 stop:1626 length:516 start_codon:yes stop_codon:yes gene_type:complete
MKKNNRIHEIIRVDHAGELGATYIYKGQLAVLKKKRIAKELKHMLAQEKEHFLKLSKLLIDYKVRPTALIPIWRLGAFGLGAMTAALGPKATMACTEAVEEVIIKHYQKQSDYLKDKDKKLSRITARLAIEEEEHFNLATQHNTGSGYYSKVLKLGIKTISKVAIKLSEKI